jgi:2-keto-4-pentenoate hydratase/2-oxohepta-3-ene-1,7-dioic acid hydratase in catechol pathway
MRSATSLVAHGAKAWCPKASEKLDYEAELAVVIGKRSGRHVPADKALDLVFGYSCFNDMSVRDYQKRTPQWTIGKNFDRTGGLGPAVVTADELPPGAVDLGIRSRLNGVVMQDATTRDMLFGVAETIVLLTECLTLEPGDVLAMGTPAGVGQSRTPPVWMKAGDRIEVEIDRVGLLVNDIAAEGT